MEFINIPFAYIMRLFDSFTQSYALSLLLFAILIKVIFIPVGIKQQKNQIKMAALRPKEAVIKKKYAGRTDRATQQKMQQELRELQQKENVSPFGGCLPLLIQMVFIFILYSIIRNPLTYICQLDKTQLVSLAKEIGYKLGDAELTLETIGKADQLAMIAKLLPQKDTLLAAYEGLKNLPNFNFFGLNLAATPWDVLNGYLKDMELPILGGIPGIKDVILYLITPLVCFLSQVLTMKLTRKFTYQSQAMQEQQGANGCSTQMMDWFMPLLSLSFCMRFSTAIGVYWIYQNILSFAQTVILAKAMPIPVLTEEDYKRAEKEMKAKGYDTKRADLPRVRSLHHIDDEDYENLPDAPKDGAKGTSQPLLNGEKVPVKDESDKKAPKLKDESDKK